MQAFAFVIEEELQRQTEGLLLMTQFPINYFAVADLDQRFDGYRDHFRKWTGVALTGEISRMMILSNRMTSCFLTGDRFWRFMRTEDYGPALEHLEGYESPFPKYGETRLLTGFD